MIINDLIQKLSTNFINCEDVVSKNAIIQKLNTMDRYISKELILCNTDKKFPKNEVFIVDDVYEEIVENLPSIQPDKYSKEEYEKIILFLLDALKGEHIGMKDFYIQEIQNKWKINFN